MKLSDYLNQQIHVVFAVTNKPATVMLKGVDVGGIWIEHQPVTETLLEIHGLAVCSTTPLVFLPYAQLKAIFVLTESVSLSEKALGLGSP